MRERVESALEAASGADEASLSAVYGAEAASAAALAFAGGYSAHFAEIAAQTAAGVAEIVRTMPLDRIVLETDCPYLTPAPYRGQRNESAYVRLVCDKIAELKGIAESGYRVIVNTGDDAQQSVHHIHVHVLGGAPMNDGSPAR